jgi:hypothetical protein
MDAPQRLREAATAAKQAEKQGEDGLAAAEWRRYRLINDANRDPDDLLSEGIALSAMALDLSAQSR